MSEDDEQGVPQAAFREERDVYMIYSFEDVAFRWEQATGPRLPPLQGNRTESETDRMNRLFGDAQMGGRLATKEEYDAW